MKILILVLSLNDNGIYSKFTKTQKETWDSIIAPNVETYYYFGNHKTNEILGNTILTNVEESLFNCGHKLLECFEIIKNFDFDLVFRTNSSSYVDKQLIRDYVDNNPYINDDFYCGINGYHNNIKFASGSGFFISKDNIIKILENKNLFNHNLIDDVAVGDILSKFGIKPIEGQRFDIVEENLSVVLKNQFPNDYFHYRLKTLNREDDIKNMKIIHNLKIDKSNE